MVARFTLDSATQFLFGYDVKSLAASIPYPESVSHLNTAEFLNHPSKVFADAFTEGQNRSIQRVRAGDIWPLSEFWKDGIEPSRKIVEAYIDPMIHKALKNKEKKPQTIQTGDDKTSIGHSGDTLLEELIQQTQGK